jgi:hypothetical protein
MLKSSKGRRGLRSGRQKIEERRMRRGASP